MKKEIIKKILEHAKKAGKISSEITVVSTANYCEITKATARTYLLHLTLQKRLKMIEEGKSEDYKFRSWRLK